MKFAYKTSGNQYTLFSTSDTFMDNIDRNNLIQFVLAGIYPAEIQQGRYAKANFRRKASHFCVEDEKLYKVSKV